MTDIRNLAAGDLDAADRIFRLAFGKEFGLPDPLTFRGDADVVRPRWRAEPEGALGAYEKGELVGSAFSARWGSFGLFGPITVHPDYWGKGIGKALLGPALDIFAKWKVRAIGLFTFPQSPKHVGLYQRYGFWPGHLTAVMAKQVEVQRDLSIELASVAECALVSEALMPGLDLSNEVNAVSRQRLGGTIGLRVEGKLVAFAVCHTGKGTEAGSGTTYIKFGAALSAEWFDPLLRACEKHAAENGSRRIVAGVNTARRDAYRRLIAKGYRAFLHGVVMHCPDDALFNRPDCFVLDDWR